MTTDNRKVELGVTVTDDTKPGFQSIAQGADNMAAKVTQSADKASKSVGGIGDGGDGAAQKLDKSTRSIINSVQRATAALEAGGNSSSKYFESIAGQRNVNADVLRPYLDQLKQAERAQQVATGGLDKMGLSAKATSAALRQVPAQFTDIITSLQGGQAPLTVLLQQGGQLKDVFGGVGAAASALGNYVLGLINPFTLAAAAVGALAVAYNLGSKEADAYNKALILTGNAAGTTAGQLQVYAEQISRVVGTQGKAAETLAAFAASGKVGSENLKQFSQTAIEFERATGTAVGETIKKFVELRNAPLQASLKLSDSTNYLTESLYKQIKALEAQGKTIEAGNVAQKAFNDYQAEATKKIVPNLGLIESAYKGVTDAIVKMGSALLAVGRTSSPESSLAALREQLARGEASLANGGPQLSSSIGASGEQNSARVRAQIEAANAALRTRIAELEKTTTATQTLAEAERQLGEQRKAFFAADQLKDKNSKSVTAAENKELAEQARIYAELAGVSTSFYKDLATAQKLLASGGLSLADYTKYVNGLVEKQPIVVEQIKAEAEAVKALRKAREDEANELDRALEQRAKSADTIGQQVQRLRDEEQAAGIAAAENISLAQAIEKVGLARLREERAKLQSQGADEGTLLYLQKEIDYREQLIDLIGNKDAREAGVKAAKDAADEWKRTAESIENSLTDALLRGFENGKGFLRNLIDTTKNLFATLVLRPQIQAVLGITGASASGASFASGGGGGSGGGFGGLPSIASFFGGNSGGQAAAKFLVGAGGFLDSFGLDVADLSASLANNALAVTNLQAGIAGLAGGFGANLLFGGKGYSTQGGSIGATAGLYLSGGNPFIAAGVSLISAAIGSLFGSGTPYNQGGVYQSRADGTGERISDSRLYDLLPGLEKAGFQDFTKRGSSQFDEATKGLAEGLQSTLSGLLQTFGKEGQDVLVAFRNNGKKSLGQVNIDGTLTNFATGENDPTKAFTAFTDAAATALLDALDKADIPAWAQKVLDGVGDAPGLEALQQVAATIEQVQSLTKALQALPFPNLKTVSEEAAIELSKLTGGLDGLNSAITTYYADFYTEAERSAETTKQLTAALAGLGVALPSSRDAFRALVNAQDLSTEAGRKMYAELLKLAPAFASVTQASVSALADIQAAVIASRNAVQDAALKASYDYAATLADQKKADKAFRDSIRAVSDSLFAEANRIRSLLPGGAAQSFAAAQSQFAITSASARSGNAEAAKLLPGLAQQLLDLAASNARSAQELALIRAQTAASLDQTGNALNKGAGINYTAPAALTQPATLNTRSTTDDVVAALKAVQDELAAMRAASDRTAASTLKTANLLTQVTRDGDAMVTTT